MWVYSELGRGTTFKAYLPRAQGEGEGAGPSDAPRPAAAGSGETILLVDDEAKLLRVLASGLRRSGYKVLCANGSAEALLLAEQHPGEIHLLLTDVVMPLLNGRQLAERLREARPQMKVVFMSGYTANVMGRLGLLDPGFLLIPKPFSISTLLRIVREALAPPAEPR